VISTLEEAKMRIKELEKENEELKAEVERLKARNLGGRKKHNEAWKSSYQEFAIKYKAGMTIMEIVKEGQISRRTAYRYKAYFNEMINQMHDSDMSDKGRTYD
jgi:regulator of replication initiation timing